MVEIPRRWLPRIDTARRIAGRLLRAARSDNALALPPLDVDRCVEGITRPFLSAELRRRLGRLWVAYGESVVLSGHEDRVRRKPVDDALDALVVSEGE